MSHKDIISLIGTFLISFVLYILNTVMVLVFSGQYLSCQRNETDVNKNGQVVALETKSLKETYFSFGFIVLSPCIFLMILNIVKWFQLENYEVTIRSTTLRSKWLTWVISPIYSPFMVLRITYKAISGDSSWKKEKRTFEEEVEHLEPFIQSLFLFIILSSGLFGGMFKSKQLFGINFKAG